MKGMRNLTVASLLSLLFVQTGAQTVDPLTLPLVQQGDLVIAGAIRVSDAYNYGGHTIAYNPAGPSLFLSKNRWVGEVSLPDPVNGPLDAMPRAADKQFQVGIIEPHAMEAGPSTLDSLGGLLVSGGKLHGTAYIFYDANNTQQRSHYTYGLTLSDATTFKGWSQVGDCAANAAGQPSCNAGFVAGQMAAIPPVWQTLLGGNALTGLCCLSITWRTSQGPTASVIDLTKVGEPVVPATMLLGYPADHPTLGPWHGSNPTYGGTTQLGGMVIPTGTGTLLFLGSNGQGPFCYGEGTGDKSLAGTPAPGGEVYCYDPLSSDKGQHAYPYNYQIWAYKLSDLAAVKAGTKQPWEVLPYGVWPLNIPMPQTQVRLTSVGFNPATNRIYATQYKGEPYPGGGGGPVIWSIDVKIGGSTPPPIPPDPPATSITLMCTVQSVGKYADQDAKLTDRCETNGKVIVPKGTKFTITLPVK